MIRDKCCRRLAFMFLSQRFAAISRPLRGSMQSASSLAGKRDDPYQQDRSCTRCRPGNQAWHPSADSGPVALRRPKATTYRCFLPDLTGFVELRRAGPSLQHRPSVPVPGCQSLEREFNPAIADCGFRAPLAPRLARPLKHTTKGSLLCQGYVIDTLVPLLLEYGSKEKDNCTQS